MTSIIKVNTIQDVGGNNLLISNGSGTITTNNIGGVMTPAFGATIGSEMSLSQNTWHTITANTEVLDTNSNYNTTNYTFTPTVAGKYYVFCNLRIADISSGTYAYFRFYKNNSTVEMLGEHYVASHGSSQNNTELTLNGLKIIDFNGSSDSIVCQVRTTTSSGADIKSGNEESNWGAYRIIGA